MIITICPLRIRDGRVNSLWHSNDDVIKWKHFPRYWPFVRGIHRSPVNFPHKDQWREALIFSLICGRINGWVNNREAGDLRRQRAHYDVIVMDNIWPHRSGSTLVQELGTQRQKAITWNNIDWLSVTSCCIHLRLISQEILEIFILNMCLTITDSIKQPHLSRGNRLIVNMRKYAIRNCHLDGLYDISRPRESKYIGKSAV